MSKKEQTENKGHHQGGNSNNVVALVIDRCKVEGCKSKSQRAGFCDEHYSWFKEGLVTVDGHFAKDFDKKYQQYMKNHKKVA